MGRDKASLEFAGEPMLQRVARILRQTFNTIVVVAAQDQKLPEIAEDIIVARDKTTGQGPLEGIRSGLEALPDNCNAAYVSSCDVPLLQVEFVKLMIEQSSGFDIAVPEADGFKHPLAAVYKKDVVTRIDQLIDNGQLRPVFLFDQVKTNIVPQSALEAVDPHLYSLMNMNSPADLESALEIARTLPAT